MRNNNVCIPDEIYRHARLCAARSYLSVSALVRKFFESLLELPSGRYGCILPEAKPAPPTPLLR